MMTLRMQLIALATALVVGSVAQATICIVPDNGSGTANLPPNCFGGGGYLSPEDVHKIIDGLPPEPPSKLAPSILNSP